MNAVEIEEAISALALEPFNADKFPYAFLEGFGNKPTTIKRLKTRTSNKSDIDNGVLQYNHIHMATCAEGEVKETLNLLRSSPATSKQKATIILATDGITFEAEDLTDEVPPIACEYKDFPVHFGFFLPLAGISTVKQIRDNSFDIKATGRLNRLYVELLRTNPEWGTAERRHDMNHFMARLIFCFFAEDTNIFSGENLFISTVNTMSARDSSNTHEIISEMFRAMNTKKKEQSSANIPCWAKDFPYVNGGLFSGNTDVPTFSKIAKSYLLHVENLDWTKINPDIFGSMIQAVADDDERGELGMHYTNEANILKVINPLFLDSLNEELVSAGENQRKLLNLRKRIARIRVFDPACGSGNFLVISYKKLREIEFEINKRRNEKINPTKIPLTNFRGIELRDFAAEIARLALTIAKYQCDVIYLGKELALAEFLPLDNENWITQGNALRLDWLNICPPTGTAVKVQGDDLFNTPLDQSEIDFENEGGETYICGNPPYKGNADQSKDQKQDMKYCLSKTFSKWKSLDYICGWFFLAQKFCQSTDARYAFVSTNSICQGQNISNFWKEMHRLGATINFAVLSFKWNNLASKNAGVKVAIIGSGVNIKPPFYIFKDLEKRSVNSINAYLVEGKNIWIDRESNSISNLSKMLKGNYYGLSDGLLMNKKEKDDLEGGGLSSKQIKIFKGSEELIKEKIRYCLWFPERNDFDCYIENQQVTDRVENVRQKRLLSPDAMAIKMAETPYQFREMRMSEKYSVATPVVSFENREFLPVTLEPNNVVFSNGVFALYDAPSGIWHS